MNELSKEELDSAKSLVRSLKLPSDANPVARAANPAVHKHFSYLRALAVKTDVPETVDTTLPDPALATTYAGQIEAFRLAFGLSDEKPAEGGAAKRQKVEKVGPPESMVSWRGLFMRAPDRPMTKADTRTRFFSHRRATGSHCGSREAWRA